MRRLFIAINLPENIKRQIENLVSQIKIDADIRWIAPENWHLTITFLGYQPDEAIKLILESLKETAASFKTPEIKFEKIIFGPPNKSPRMIWLTTAKETSQKLSTIKIYLENALIKNGVRFKKENREYNGHLTLARFPQTQITPKINTSHRYESTLAFYATNLDLMESRLKKTGSEYEVLAKVDFLKQI